MNGVLLNEQEKELIVPGEGFTIAAVMAILVIAIVAIVCYKMFKSDKGSAKLPGGYAFEWK
ncbi:MAG: hypothetical protein IJ247_01930 [Bacilli bacterium]|nr:hypothetical protein [Bacilli bacterium]